MPDYRNASYPNDQHSDHVEYEYHQWLIPGRKSHCAHIEFAHLAVFRFILGYLEIFASESFYNAHTTKTLLHHRTQRPSFVLHIQPNWAQTTAHLNGEQYEDRHTDHSNQ